MQIFIFSVIHLRFTAFKSLIYLWNLAKLFIKELCTTVEIISLLKCVFCMAEGTIKTDFKLLVVWTYVHELGAS